MAEEVKIANDSMTFFSQWDDLKDVKECQFIT